MSLDTFASSLADALDTTDQGDVRSDYANRQAGYLHDPVGWATDFIDWRAESLTTYQAEILTDLHAHGREAVRGPHGLGKTTANALAVLHFSATRDMLGIDWKVVTTAGAWRQLIKYLWPEIHKWARRIRWDELGVAPWRDGKELLDLSIKLNYGEAFAAASSNKELIEGAHADHILYVFDEAKAIPADIWDAAEGAFSGATDGRIALALAQSTPGEPAGRLYDIHARRPGLEDWHTRHVTKLEAIKAGRMSADWAEQRRKQWGADSAVYANRVEGEFHSSDEDAVIPLAWIEAANDRWDEWNETGRREQPGLQTLGVDVARSGEDKTVIAIRRGPVVEELRTYAKQDTMATAGKVAGLLNWPDATAIVDTDGLGAGVTDRLRERGKQVLAFHAGTKTTRKDRSGELGFVNTRSAAWWNLREMLDPAYGENIALPRDDTLTGDLTAPHWRVESNSKIAVESRDSIIARIGRSPDHGTAVMQAFWTAAGSNAGGVAIGWDLYDESSDIDFLVDA